MSSLPPLAASLVGVAFLLSATADVAAPGGAAETAAPIMMPIAGMPDSQVYVYPMAADPRHAARAAADQLRAFAAMFHNADPETYRVFLEQWRKVEEQRTPATRSADER